jgi:hypothetical protein
VFDKDFFDLTKEKAIRGHFAGLKRKQAIVAGCETDVCVLQSCLGPFSSARNVDAAIARMQAAGAVFVSYKTLFYELLEAVDGNPPSDKMLKTYGPLPDDLPDAL